MDLLNFVRPVGLPQLGSLADAPLVLLVLLATMWGLAFDHLRRPAAPDDAPLQAESAEAGQVRT